MSQSFNLEQVAFTQETVKTNFDTVTLGLTNIGFEWVD